MKEVLIIDKNEFLKEQLDLLKRKQVDADLEWQDIADFRSEYAISDERYEEDFSYFVCGNVFVSSENESLSFGRKMRK